MDILFIILYIITIGLCLSTYAFYPIIIWLIGKVAPLKVHKHEFVPTVSIIIPAYNEAKNILKKIHNTLELDYPNKKLEILIGSDGSKDETVELAKQIMDKRVRVFDFKENRGKTAVQNDLVREAKGEVLIFTDAASFLPLEAITKMVQNFADERVGCVAGRLRFIETDATLTTESQGLYWRYEIKIRGLESRIGRLIGVDGPLYAVRRDCYIPLENNIISDLISPLLVLKQGKKVILEPKALVDEAPTVRTGQEFKTRRRITLRGLVGIAAYIDLMNPLSHPLLAFQIFFHKVLRWIIGPVVIINGLACLALTERWFFKVYIAHYVLFFVAAAIGGILERFGIKISLLTIPYYFTLVNFAATAGVLDFLRKKQVISWTPVRK
ncbi:putative Glycosyl transferase, family II [uncultured Desulfobacterium sp.]|uniref:Putative Glycosyl transferase, family II n=1 Tax=uncultured Desulfobacterium sp. TaxID=201089 RepID=A0A445MZS5_9BACT|nr:putative Glycosyl transferase, family II [uncultured Desulfobacterium sp.]